MSDMQKDVRITIRIPARTRDKVIECAKVMGCSEGEFTRRCILVMLMVMGDEESKAAIHGILDAAIITGSTMKTGAGLAPVPPKAGVTRTPPPTPRGRKGQAGR